MFILPMAALCDDQVPAISLNEVDDVTNLHNRDSSIIGWRVSSLMTLFARSGPTVSVSGRGDFANPFNNYCTKLCKLRPESRGRSPVRCTPCWAGFNC